MVEYTDKKLLLRWLNEFCALKDRSYTSLRAIISEWVYLFTGYQGAVCEFTQTQMRITGTGFVLVNYDFKHDRELHGRLQAIGIDADALTLIKLIIADLDNRLKGGTGVCCGAPVRVKFVNDRETWRQVVEESGEVMFVDDEDNECFIAEYGNQAEFNEALARFQGMIQYEVL